MDDDGNSSDEAMGPQTQPEEMDFSEILDAVAELQASVTRFAESDESGQEGLLAAIKQMGAQLRTTDANVQKDRAQIEKLEGWIRYNRF